MNSVALLPYSPDGLAIYTCGQFGNGSLFVATFDPAGTLVWQRPWGENGNIANGVAALQWDIASGCGQRQLFCSIGSDSHGWGRFGDRYFSWIAALARLSRA